LARLAKRPIAVKPMIEVIFGIFGFKVPIEVSNAFAASDPRIAALLENA
jgi:hypothetical protein